MKTSPLAAALASTDPSPVVTPAQLIAFGETLLTEIKHLIDEQSARAPISTPLEKLKAYSTIADLKRTTGLSRQRIATILYRHPEIRTLNSDSYSYFRRIHTQDFLATVAALANPANNNNSPKP